jgi:hypothetical protein
MRLLGKNNLILIIIGEWFLLPLVILLNLASKVAFKITKNDVFYEFVEMVLLCIAFLSYSYFSFVFLSYTITGHPLFLINDWRAVPIAALIVLIAFIYLLLMDAVLNYKESLYTIYPNPWKFPSSWIISY